MIDLAALARIADQQARFRQTAIAPLRLGARFIDTDAGAAIMAAINLSQDSSYRTSIAPDVDSAVRRARIASAEGADVIDLGAESSNERADRVDPQEQLRLLRPVVAALTGLGIHTSIESYYPAVIEDLVGRGAAVINLTGSQDDDAVFGIAAQSGATLVLCYVPQANVRQASALPVGPDGVAAVAEQLRPRVERALAAGVSNLVIDPGIGFSYANLRDPSARIAAQGRYLLHGATLRQFGFPVLQSLPNAFAVFQEHYRTAEGYFAVLALLGGAGVLRVHEPGHVRAVREAMSLGIGSDG